MSLSKKIGFSWFCVLVAVVLLSNPGVTDETESPELSEEPKSLYELLEWDVNEYFGDFIDGLGVCRAIEEMNAENVNGIDIHLGFPLIDDDMPLSLRPIPSPELQQSALRIVNTKGVDNMTPLMWSLASNFETFEHLLKRGANPNIAYIGLPSRMLKARMNYDEKYRRERTKYGERCLMLRAINNKFRRNCTVVECLAAHPDSRWLKAALENGWDPNFRPGTALMIAADEGNMDNFWLLVEAGADINQCRSSFEIVFYEAPEELIPVLEKLTDECIRRRILDLVTSPIEELWKDGFVDNLSSQHWRRGRQRLLDALVTQGVDPVKYWEEYQEWKKTSDFRSLAERYGGPYDVREMFRSIIENPIMIPFEVPRLPNRTLTGKQGVP